MNLENANSVVTSDVSTSENASDISRTCLKLTDDTKKTKQTHDRSTKLNNLQDTFLTYATEEELDAQLAKYIKLERKELHKPTNKHKSISKNQAVHMELYSTPPSQEAVIVQHLGNKEMDLPDVEQYEDAICQLQCPYCMQANKKLTPSIEELRTTTGTVGQQQYVSSNNESKGIEVPNRKINIKMNSNSSLNLSKLEITRLQVEKQYKEIELLDLMLARERGKLLYQNMKFDKEMALLQAEIEKMQATSSTNLK